MRVKRRTARLEAAVETDREDPTLFPQVIGFRFTSDEQTLLSVGADGIADFVCQHFRAELQKYEAELRGQLGFAANTGRTK